MQVSIGIGIPILVVAYKFSESADESLILLQPDIEIIYSINLELNFLNLMFINIFNNYRSNLFGGVEIINRYIQIRVVKKFSIDLIKKFKKANWLSILEDKSGKFNMQ